MRLIKFFSMVLVMLWSLPGQAGELKFSQLQLSHNMAVSAYIHLDRARFNSQKVLLALAPGHQDQASVRDGIGRWAEKFKAEGWTIISPVAPMHRLFSGRGMGLLPMILDGVAKQYEVKLDKVFVFGVSNGGIAALEVAAHYPALFHSVTVMPGLLHSQHLLKNLTGLPVNIIVGEKDGFWTERGQGLVRDLNKNGGDAELSLIKGADHFAFRQVSYDYLIHRIMRSLGAISPKR